MNTMRRGNAFTLVELLVVITIIGILIALLLPAVQAAREVARKMQCSNNLKQIALALHGYHSIHCTLPYASGSCCGPGDEQEVGRRSSGGTWPTMILPQLEQSGLYDQINFNEYMQRQPAAILKTVVSVYVCPTDVGNSAVLEGRFTSVGGGGFPSPGLVAGIWYTGSMGPTEPDLAPLCAPPGNPPPPCGSAGNYCCKKGAFGTIPPGSSVGMFGRHRTPITFDSVHDGLSNTIMLGETLPRQCSLYSLFAVNHTLSPTNIPINTMQSDEGLPPGTNYWLVCGFKSMHSGGANFAMADGSIQFFSEMIDYKLYNELGTRAGDESVIVP